jgi:excinuclease UvrABC nuclease subunit
MPDWIEMFDARLDVGAEFPDEQSRQIPARRGVVLLLAEGGSPILLLTAADIRSRTVNRLRNPDPQERRKLPNLQEIAREIRWKLTTSHFETDLAFLDLSAAIWPKGFTEMVAWRPAWFVHVDCGGPFPRFVRTREVLAGPGRYVGPFEDGRWADRFVGAIQDAFDLCRNHQCVRKAPRGPPCTYSQMGRCLGVGDGRTSLEDYRRVVAQAADFAAGGRQSHHQELTARMKAAAAARRFEEAAKIKSRLDRLAELDQPACAHAAPAEEFRFLVIQPGPTPRRARPFLVNRGTVLPAEDLDYPARQEQLAGLLEQMRRLAACPPSGEFTELDRLRMGLVSHYLCSGPNRRGVMIRWRDSLSCPEVVGAIESAAEVLHLRAGRKQSTDQPPRTTGLAGG